MKTTYLIRFLCLIMPLSSGAYQPPIQSPVINQENVNIPQEYLVPFVQPAPDNQPRNPVVPVPLNIIDQVGNVNERFDRQFLPCVFAVTCPAVMLILLLRALID